MQRAVTTVLVERDNVAQVRLSIVNQEFTVLRAADAVRAADIATRTLTREARILDSARRCRRGSGSAVKRRSGSRSGIVREHAVRRPRRPVRLLPRRGHQLQRRRGADHRRAARPAGARTAAASDRHLRLSQPGSTRSRSAASPTIRTPRGARPTPLASRAFPRPRSRSSASRARSPGRTRPITSSSRRPEPQSLCATSEAARSPERTAPSMYPLKVSAVSVPAQ